MAKKFKDLVAKMPPAAQEQIQSRTQELMDEMPLAELREALRLTQQQMAEVLEVKQPAVAKLEKKTDMYLSTLRRFIEAMGGELEIRAVFKEGEVKINQFKDLDKVKQA